MALLLEIDVKDNGTAKVKKFTDTTAKEWRQAEVKTTKSSAKMKQNFNAVSGSVKAMRMQMLLVTGVIVGIGVAIKKVADDTANYRDDIMKLSNATGIATESLAGFQFAVQIGGQSAETFDRGIKALLRSMQGVKEGLTESQRAFDQLGINVLDTNGSMRAGEEVFLDTAEALKNMTNDTERAALAQRLFGRAGIDLLPTLNMGKEGIEELQEKAKSLGLTFDREAGEAAEAYNDRMLEMNLAMKGASQVLGELLIPTISGFSEGLTESFIAIRVLSEGIIETFGGEPALLLANFGKALGLIPKFLLTGGDAGSAFAAALQTLATDAGESEDKVDGLTETVIRYRQAIQLAQETVGEKGLGLAIPEAETGLISKIKDREEKQLQIFRDSIKEKAALQQAAFETRIEIEEAETEALINEHSERLNQEMELDVQRTDAMAEEVERRTLIKESELQAAQNISSLLGNLLILATAGTKKASDAQKAASIVNTGVSTYSAAQKAFESQIIIGDPTSPVRGAVAAAAAVAAGLARVSKIASFQSGGIIGGQTDAVPILGHRGEGVVNRRGMDSLGERGLRNLNQGKSAGGNTFQIILPNVTNITDESVRLEIVPRLQRMIDDDGVRFN